MTYPVHLGKLDVTPAVEMVAGGVNSVLKIRAKLLELVSADDCVDPSEAEALTDEVLVAFRDFALWIPEVAAWRLAHRFVQTCPVCTLDLMSTTENNLMVVDKWRDGPLEGKARYVSCLVCDLLLQPLRVVPYIVKGSKKARAKAAKKGENGDDLMGVAVQGLEPVGIMLPDLSEAGMIVRLLPQDRIELFPKMWESAAGIVEAYTQRVLSMVQYWDDLDGVKKPAPAPKIYGPDGGTLH